MALRRKEFEHKFKFVWTTGPTGCSKFYVTAPTQASGEKLIAALLAKTLTADVEQQNVNIRREFITNADQTFEHRENVHRITGVTKDERVAELIEEISAHKIGSDLVPFDAIITPLINASPDYIDWVKLQTMKKDFNVAFYNIDPEAEMKGLNN